MDAPLNHAWLPFLPAELPGDLHSPAEIAAAELEAAAEQTHTSVPELYTEAGFGDMYEILMGFHGAQIIGGETGVLYGAYRYIQAIAAGEPVPTGLQRPAYALRALNAWDNPDGTIERGYAGKSLWFSEGKLRYDARRLRFLARLLASQGINALAINNVNVSEEAAHLLDTHLQDVAALAALFRPFGVRLLLSVDFSCPLRNGLITADPLDESVKQYWREKTAAVYREIPDLAGFLVKADSEHRPGPRDYGRTQAEGANLLADALAPFGGALIWRAFVYNCAQDWRDQSIDRPKAAYETFVPLDGAFRDNVILQIKHGPYDFQVREPVSPSFYALSRTNLGLEVQLAQEYTGQQIDLYQMNPMWAELAEELPLEKLSAVAAVSNLGDDTNWFGHPFAAANLYGFGAFAWDPNAKPQEVVRRWARLTYHLPEAQEQRLVEMLLRSRTVYESYTAPLGLNWMVRPGGHYGPSPEGYEFDRWGTYIRADRNAVGIDRTSAGTGYVDQYPEDMRARYANPETCPENLLLFFHRLAYDDRLRDGRTLIQRIYDDHFTGAEAVREMLGDLRRLELPEADKTEALRRMEMQLNNAEEWRDVINTYFHRLSGVEDEKGRTIYP